VGLYHRIQKANADLLKTAVHRQMQQPQLEAAEKARQRTQKPYR